MATTAPPILGVVIFGAALAVLILLIVRQRQRVAPGGSAIEVAGGSPSVAFHAPDAGGTFDANATTHLAAPLDVAQHSMFPMQAEWTAHIEQPAQTNDSAERSGAFWPHTWTPVGPIDPLTPRTTMGEITPGPTDPQLVYGMAITAAMDGQAEKFCVTEDPNDVTYKYRNALQQVPGSHFPVFGPSFNAAESPQVVNRFAALPRRAAAWVVARMNERLRAEHPCFSLSGREHFEISNPPQQCGSPGSPKHNPLTVIRVFDSRVQHMPDGTQRLYLTMELGNAITAGAGGMFTTEVTIDAHGNFTDYTTPERDAKHTFVLPRSR